jgi:histidinol phosphatase-like PHP family hydrolase
MIELHTHSFLSDGELLPEELARRAETVGCRVIVIADHVGFSNVEQVVPALLSAAKKLTDAGALVVVPGAELTHCPPGQFAELAERARALGARWLVGHGETLVEPVAPGTNRAAIAAGVDVLAHPGLISEEDAWEAARKGVALEVTARKGHCLTNGHVAMIARRVGASTVFGSDAHAAEDLCSREFADRVLRGAGLSPEEVEAVWERTAKRIQGRV